ncbi:hypothetical protein SeMB42_g00595 [Synchytrium endobioticum]|nr:hypothetical protein SeMB42_g00595 [Synchytrium endobioticum]
MDIHELEALRRENAYLRTQLDQLKTSHSACNEHQPVSSHSTSGQAPHELTRWDIARYSRQLLVPEIGVAGQRALKQASVLVVGAGGLGAPNILYLAAAGVGRIGIVDHDVVERSNLQRQVIHDESRIGLSKAASAKSSVDKLNSSIECIAYEYLLDSSNAMDIISKHDIVIDASDNAATRYLINDACVLLNKTLVSASALRMDGQLSVYHHPISTSTSDPISPTDYSPCYRCIFPTPPPPSTVLNCSDGGVLGVVTGIIGCIQALEAIKIIAGMGSSYAGKLLILDAATLSFRVVGLRKRKSGCLVCGDEPVIKELVDYVAFCGAGPHDKATTQRVLSPKDRITSRELLDIRASLQPHVLLDVREKIEFDICSLPDSIHVPLKELETRLPELSKVLNKAPSIYVLCKRGNDSQLATRLLLNKGFMNVKDVTGGLVSWANDVDPQFPLY